MYNHFFGFKEKPFRLIPNPDYLFLSQSHEEALAHLKYAAKEGEGFVEIIGEVGTGKTMLCRAFLENIDADTESAYIFNPKMDATDLLKAINDEFGISSEGGTIKSLIDALNTFLMEKRAEGKKAILLIDEAQNLSPEVLEQIRLLSNLETTRDKLLQIILVGQPELGDLLDSHALRQIGQRISLRCRLKPLSYAETRAYIRHRIQVASQKPAVVFSRSAIRKIYRYTHGIPRLINIACDRALLAAYGFNRQRVTGSIAKTAVFELSSRGEIRRSVLAAGQRRVAILALICVGLFAVLVYQSEIRGFISTAIPGKKLHRPAHIAKTVHKKVRSAVRPDDARRAIRNGDASGNPGPKDSVSATALARTAPAIVHSSNPKPDAANIDIKSMLDALPAQTTRTSALQAVLKKWGAASTISADLEDITDAGMFFTLAARQQGLFVHKITDNMGMILNLNVCAIFAFTHPEKHYPIYLPLVGAGNGTLTFINSRTGEPVTVSRNAIKPFWSGTAWVFWKNFYNYQGIIPLDAPKVSILALKIQLRKMGFQGIGLDSDYDLYTQLAVKAIQARYGIPVDGYVGPLTKIVLYNATPALAIPHLQKMNIAAAGAPVSTRAADLSLPIPAVTPRPAERDGADR